MKQLTMISIWLLFWLPLSAWSAPAVEVYGVWKGMLTEVVRAGHQYDQYEVTLTLAPNDYRIDYGRLNCGGSLRLLVKKGRFFRFRDELNYGLDVCSNDGRTELHFIGPERAMYQWFNADGVLKVKGYLKRQRQVMA